MRAVGIGGDPVVQRRCPLSGSPNGIGGLFDTSVVDNPRWSQKLSHSYDTTLVWSALSAGYRDIK
jgi:hypothetical protein